MPTDDNTALDQATFSGRCILSPHQTYPNKPFEGFESVLILAAFYGLEHEFKTMPEAPVFPEVCQAFFNNQRRVSFDMMTQQLSAIDTLKITKDQIEEVYQSSLLLNAECAYIKVLDQFLISELQSNKAIYVFFIQGYLRACSELEAQAFLKHYQAVTEYRRLIDQFSNLSHLVRITKLKAETCEQAEKINQALKVNWKGVFAVQSRLLHGRNHFGNQKKSTVAHIRLKDDYKSGRITREAGQILCGAKSKFGYSDDMSDQTSYLITCPKCLAMADLA